MPPRKFIRLFYFYQFFFDFILLYAAEKLFLISRGVDLAQIGSLLFLWSLMSILFEVPTGALADHWSRRKMLILAGIFFSVCYLIWAMSSSYWLFLLGFFFRTLGGTFASGTLQAYLFDYLKINQLEKEFEKIWGKGNALRTFGIGVAVLLGGIISEWSYFSTTLLSSISILGISLIAYRWPEVSSSTSTQEQNYWRFILQSIQSVKQNRSLIRIVLYSGLVLSVFSSLEEYNDVYLRFLGFPNSIIGVIFFSATLGQSLASIYAHRFKKYSWKMLNGCALLGLLLLVLVSLINQPIMALAIYFMGIMLEFAQILNEGVIQKEVPSQQRATISSLNSLVLNLVPFQLFFGLIAKHHHLQLSYGFLAIGISLYLVIMAGFRTKNETACAHQP